MKVNSLILQTESYWQRETQKLEVCQNNQKKKSPKEKQRGSQLSKNCLLLEAVYHVIRYF